MVTILFLGDVVGEPGRSAVIANLARLKESHAVDFVVVNGENAAGGRGITPKITIDLLRAGVSVITTGDHIWDQKDIVPFLALEPRLLRPLNYPDGAPGSGSIVLETAKGKIGVINVQARTFMQPILENPFPAIEAAVTAMRQQTSNLCGRAWRNHERENCDRALSRRQSIGCDRDAHSRPDRRRTNLSRRNGVSVRRRNVRAGKFDPGPRRRANREPLHFQFAGVVSGGQRRRALMRRGGFHR